ncbi:ABC transporter substrate-binding protein [Deinococcus wulumuqiensis]|uniref:ABC transporter substrate-binding protein n=1 Tax=Deinococcus wulumuqiensis TaxID=980427 RepID=A0A345IF59_9DEIO|nr:ABC transporter substrate-binding protein [Deinococcus wulumuqiensis]AXG98331.1 ABC transporter substrate-binding protein [Deinococcus wulumuqiensis]
MKKILTLALALTLGNAAAQADFVYPQAWSADPAASAKTGGELRTYTLSDFKTLNPFVSKEADSLPNSYFNLGAGLFTQDPRNDKFIPVMAASMPTVSNNGKRFVVKIRQGMKFSDGQAITADDWVSTLAIHKDDKVGSNSYDSFFINKKPVTVKKLDTYTLQFDFPTVDVSAYSKMSYTPWPDHVFGKAYRSGGAAAVTKLWPLNTPGSNIVVPGAWTLESFQAGQRVVLKKNTRFGEWNKDSAGKALPYLDRLSFRVIENQNAALAAYLAGQIDTFGPRNADDLAQIKRAIDGGNLKAELFANVGPQATSTWVVWNWNKSGDPFKQKIFRDVRFRRAMSHIANRKAMVQLTLGGLGTEVYSSVYPIFKNYTYASTPKYSYDLDQARKLLAQMGFTKKDKDGWLVDAQGRRLEFTLNTNSGNTVREQQGRIFADEAKKVGVKINFNPIDFNNLVDLMYEKGENRKFDSILLSFAGGTNYWPYSSNTVTCGGSLHAYNNPTNGACLTSQEQLITKLFNQGQQTLDDTKRRAVGEQLSKAMAELQPFVYLAGSNYHVSFNSRLGGEMPRNLWDAYYGSRLNVLTYIK